MVSAIMQAVSGERLAVELARNGGVSFIYGSQTPEDEAAMVARVKAKKAGFVFSDSNLAPVNTLADILALKERRGIPRWRLQRTVHRTGNWWGSYRAVITV